MISNKKGIISGTIKIIGLIAIIIIMAFFVLKGSDLITNENSLNIDSLSNNNENESNETLNFSIHATTDELIDTSENEETNNNANANNAESETTNQEITTCSGEGIYNDMAGCKADTDCDESIGFKCSTNFKTGCTDCIYQEVVNTFPTGSICGINLNCPPAKENCELIGKTYLMNYQVMDSWGTSKHNKNGYTYINSKTKKTNNKTCDEIVSCSYNCIEPKTTEQLNINNCRFEEECGIATTNGETQITDCQGNVCSNFEIISTITNELIADQTEETETTETTEETEETTEEETETQTPTCESENLFSELGDCMISCQESSECHQAGECWDCIELMNEYTCATPDHLECELIGKHVNGESWGDIQPHFPESYVRSTRENGNTLNCIYNCNTPGFEFSQTCIEDMDCEEAKFDGGAYFCIEGPCMFDFNLGITH